MNIIRCFTTDDLGRSKPADGLFPVTVQEHARCFYDFDTCDVWTDGGWLVTAVQNDGVTHHLRKGTEAVVVVLPFHQVLHYKPNKKTKYYGWN